MNGGLLLPRWRPPLLLPPPPPPLHLSFLRPCSAVRAVSLPQEAVDASSAGGTDGEELTARERRKLRSERREASAGGRNWREEVEERLMHKPKKRPASSWTEKLNLDLLARLGPQWWVVRVSRVNGQESADRLARAVAREFPTFDFKVYFPSLMQNTKLKSGKFSTKMKALYPGCVFLFCVLNKEVHDFIREIDGIGGFVGSIVGNTKRQINRPKPVSVADMEAIFKEAKDQQQILDEAFKEEHQEQETNTESSVKSPKSKHSRQTKKDVQSPSSSSVVEDDQNSLAPGTSIRILSGPFADLVGCIKELNRKSGKVTVGMTLFGKESFVVLERDQIAPK